MTKTERTRVAEGVYIYPRGKKGTYNIDYHWRGKHKRQSLKTGNKRVAERNALEIATQLVNGEFRPRISLAIDALRQQYLEDIREKRSGKTYSAYAHETGKFVEYANKNGCRKANEMDVQLFKAYRKQRGKLAPYTTYNRNVIIKGMFNWAVLNGLLDSNPLARVRFEKPERPRHPAISRDELVQVISKADDELRLIIKTASMTGLRIGEIQNLKRDDVDLKQQLIHVRRGKTKAAMRDVPIHQDILSCLASHKPCGKTYFFNAPPSRKFPRGEHHINPRDVNETFQKVVKACGYRVGRKNNGLTFHSLRRFFKTQAIEAGVPIPLVDYWLGHHNKNDINTHYYRPENHHEWIRRVPCPF